MERIKVAVSPFFGGKDWTDELTNIRFEKNPRGLNVYSIPTDLDLAGVKKAIHLKSLIVVEDNVGMFNEVNNIIVEAPKQEEKVEAPKEEAPVEEVKAEEPAEEVKVETQAVEEKPKTTRRRTTKKSTAEEAE
jgi:hypothetical protein